MNCGLVDWIMVALLASALVIYLMQRNATIAASRADNFFALVDFLQQPDVRKARRVVQTSLSDQPASAWGEDEVEAAQLVASTYDIAAVAIHYKLLRSEAFTIPWSSSITSNFEAIRQYIRDLQAERGEMYFAHFTGLAYHLSPRLKTEDGPYGVTFD